MFFEDEPEHIRKARGIPLTSTAGSRSVTLAAMRRDSDDTGVTLTSNTKQQENYVLTNQARDN